MIKCFQPPNLVYNQPSPFWYQSPTVSSKSPQCLLFLLACEVKCHVVINHKKAGNGQRDPKDLLWPSHALLVATNLLWELHWRQWHQKYKVCWHPPHWERDQNFTRRQFKPFCQGNNHICVTSIDSKHKGAEARFIFLVQVQAEVCRLPALKIEQLHDAFFVTQPAKGVDISFNHFRHAFLLISFLVGNPLNNQ